MVNELRLPAQYAERFGVRVALADAVTAAGLEDVLARCAAEGAALLIARCPASDLPAAHALEAAGARLMDTLVYYRRALGPGTPPLPPPPAETVIRPARGEDANRVEAITAAAFAGYDSHFHADPRLDRAACDAVYTSWARNSVLMPGVADAVLVAEVAGRVAGFLTLKWVDEATGEGPLYGVAPEFQGRGLGQALLHHGLRWFAERGAAGMQMSTQVTNTRSQTAWIRQGFRPDHALYTFHRWFD